MIIFSYILCFLAIYLIYDLINNKSYNNSLDKISENDRRIVLFCNIALLISLYISFVLKDALLSTCIIVSFPFFIYSLFRSFYKDILRSVRYPLAIINLFIAFIYPSLFIAIFILFYICKYYYWHRFNIHYPTFLVDD